jgi:hypothetical protein
MYLYSRNMSEGDSKGGVLEGRAPLAGLLRAAAAASGTLAPATAAAAVALGVGGAGCSVEGFMVATREVENTSVLAAGTPGRSSWMDTQGSATCTYMPAPLDAP